MAKRARFIKAYIMHGHIDSGPLDYEDLFRWFYDTPPRATQIDVSRDLAIAVERMTRRGPYLDIRFVSGNPRGNPLFYNEATGLSEPASTPEGTWPAVPTRVTIVPSKRILLLESRKQGVGVATLEHYFGELARINRFANRLQLHLSPLPSSSFEEEIAGLARIMKAALEVNRPNTDWDDANDVLSGLADESDGQKAEVIVSAGRGGSLSRDSGIVELILAHIRRTLTNVRNARVVGRREGEAAVRTVTIEKHQLRAGAGVDDRLSEYEQDEAVFGLAHELADVAMTLHDHADRGIGSAEQARGELPPGGTTSASESS